MTGKMNKVSRIVYDKYNWKGTYVGRREYVPKDIADYDRVMEIIERNPEEYEVVNFEYEQK